MFGNGKQEVVISETDIEAALDHLRTLPYRTARPVAWDRKHLLNLLGGAIGDRPKVDQCHNIAPGVFAMVKPFGVDLASQDEPDGGDGRLQVWLLIRSGGTDPSRITAL
jgi:hypothetical protein